MYIALHMFARRLHVFTSLLYRSSPPPTHTEHIMISVPWPSSRGHVRQALVGLHRRVKRMDPFLRIGFNR